MQQSITSRNKEVSFEGILEPILSFLETNSKKANHMIGQEIVIPRGDVKTVLAVDESGNVHLLVSTTGTISASLSKINLRGLTIDQKDWSVADLPTQNYLDLTCVTGISPQFKRPFLKFVEDVLYELTDSLKTPNDAVHSTCVRWKYFWGSDTSLEVTREWIYGLFGELAFLLEMVERLGPSVLLSWEGPFGKDHDFQTGKELAVEIKTSTEVPFQINCNVHQLDTQLFKKLYIVCYRLKISDSGRTLPELVKNIEQLLKSDVILLDSFYSHLKAVGYQRQLEQKYSEYPLEASSAVVFNVDSSFPKITERSFITAPDHRVSGIRYRLELTGLDELTIDSVMDDFKILKNER